MPHQFDSLEHRYCFLFILEQTSLDGVSGAHLLTPLPCLPSSSARDQRSAGAQREMLPSQSVTQLQCFHKQVMMIDSHA